MSETPEYGTPQEMAVPPPEVSGARRIRPVQDDNGGEILLPSERDALERRRQSIRAQALEQAVRMHAIEKGQSYSSVQPEAVLDTAERFAKWIELGQRRG